MALHEATAKAEENELQPSPVLPPIYAALLLWLELTPQTSGFKFQFSDFVAE
jgi:hypothetical protein